MRKQSELSRRNNTILPFTGSDIMDRLFVPLMKFCILFKLTRAIVLGHNIKMGAMREGNKATYIGLNHLSTYDIVSDKSIRRYGGSLTFIDTREMIFSKSTYMEIQILHIRNK